MKSSIEKLEQHRELFRDTWANVRERAEEDAQALWKR
jgi:hypothetical protein